MFVLSKLLWIVAQPGNLLLLMLALGVLRCWRSGGRRGFPLVVLPTLAFLAVAVLPLGEWVAAPLEARFPAVRELPARVDGVVVLGGAIDTESSLAHGQVALNDAAERLTTAAMLARRYPAARLVLSGGNGEILAGTTSEASLMAELLAGLGVERDRLVLEDRSRNTFENAVDAKALAQPEPGQTWLLVTSAAHMPRAMGCFRHAGWAITAFPVDYHTGRALTPDRFELADDLALFDHAAREWAGLVAYRARGRIDALFPGP
jgi:uncharacterized SAM-binding protein YcdF (DUF218 family)